jgi:hypothetical protein
LASRVVVVISTALSGEVEEPGWRGVMGRQPSLDGAMEGSRERRRDGWKRGSGVVIERSVGLGAGERRRDGSERRPGKWDWESESE